MENFVSSGFYGRIVVKIRVLDNFLVRKFTVVLSIGSLIHGDNNAATEAKIMLQRGLGVDQAVVRPSAPMTTLACFNAMIGLG